MSTQAREMPMESPVAKAEIGPTTSPRLVPSNEDMRDFFSREPRSAHYSACEPDFVDFGDRSERMLQPTRKRMEYDILANKALNQPERARSGPHS